MPPPSPSGRTPGGEPTYTGGFAAIVSDYMTSREASFTLKIFFFALGGRSKNGVRPFVTLLFVRRTSYRRKSPFGLGFFAFDRARSLVVHHLVWGHLVKWFGRGGHRCGRRLRSHVLGMGENDHVLCAALLPSRYIISV